MFFIIPSENCMSKGGTIMQKSCRGDDSFLRTNYNVGINYPDRISKYKDKLF
jgi:hypothetical protein